MFNILANEAPSSDHCQECHTSSDLHHCLDCLGSPLLCKRCIVTSHCHLPFHCIQSWTRQYFQPCHLVDLGYIIHLGHHSDPCPSSAKNGCQSTMLCIVDCNRVFHHQVQWCCCLDAPPLHVQLLQMRFFPAMVERPETVFMFSVLEYFHIDALECKTLANNFYNKLRQLTNSAFPHQVPVS